MHIVQLIADLDVGGAQRVASLLSQDLVRRGHTVDFISLYDSMGTWIERELAQTPPGGSGGSLRLHFLGKRPGLDLRVIPRLGSLLRRLRPDVVHSHLHTVKYLMPALGPRLLPFYIRPRLFHTLHNLAEYEIESSGQVFHQVAFRAGVHPIAIGDAVARSIERVYHLCPTATIPNGIPVDEYRSPAGTREAVRAELGVGDHTQVFLTAGRLNRQKNHELLIAALQRLQGSEPKGAGDAGSPPGVLVLIAGDGDLRASLEQQAAGLPVRFLGVRRDMPRLMAAADAFVLPSRWEGNPMAVMEAMAASLPVIATDVGCVSELVVPGTGRVVPEGDVGALAAAMRELGRDECRQLGRAAAKVARERFDVGVMTDGYLRVFGGRPSPLTP